MFAYFWFAVSWVVVGVLGWDFCVVCVGIRQNFSWFGVRWVCLTCLRVGFSGVV